ncbi:hypothetical protein SYNPCC7002_D0002 (plasmid) [Picosynechococcus sp. PCC 7002]|uniref:hypothetical protein n=1 Tax=Picosynechococcus sp. (strain ATCC 27264 / PCC 7002 / PR-6) TaxID=32049 RepID=UPI00016DCDF1|nr:hypothetical protein [Picosynechococcus sp. PCC 7002]ACB00864.1 hypothetical protein SYNPCC7002_D0002 [Picosynechococcus sp. PCC 7002]
MSSKFGDIIGKAKQTSKPDDQISGKQDKQSTETEKMANLCVKVPKTLRQLGRQKRNGMESP